MHGLCAAGRVDHDQAAVDEQRIRAAKFPFGIRAAWGKGAPHGGGNRLVLMRIVGIVDQTADSTHSRFLLLSVSFLSVVCAAKNGNFRMNWADYTNRSVKSGFHPV